MRISIGNAGWVYYEADGIDPVYVRFAETDDGRLGIEDLFVGFASSPTARTMRDLTRHLSALERWVNERDTAAAVRSRLTIPGPALSTAASYYATTSNEDHWAALMLRSQIKGSGVPQAPHQAPSSSTIEGSRAALDRILLGFKVPATRPYPDEFYAEVAEAYAEAARSSQRPAAEIAASVGVPVSAVHRWVAEARKRGHLAPGRKGRAG